MNARVFDPSSPYPTATQSSTVEQEKFGTFDSKCGKHSEIPKQKDLVNIVRELLSGQLFKEEKKTLRRRLENSEFWFLIIIRTRVLNLRRGSQRGQEKEDETRKGE